MARKLKTDAWLFSATLLLLAVSVAWVYSASAKAQDPESVLLRQAAWIVLGGAGMLAALRVDYKLYREPRVLQVLVGVTVLALAVVFFRPAAGGSRRWLEFFGLGIQPSEGAKLVAALFAAATIGAKLEANEPTAPAFARAGLVGLGLAGLIACEPDAGSALALVAIVAAILFTGGLSYRWVGVAGLAGVLGGVGLVLLEPYRLERIKGFLNPTADLLGRNYQAHQGLIAVGTGGWLGRGYWEGIQKLGFLPMAHNDYIFAVIAEERGLVGATVVLLCFAVILARGLRVARCAPDAFGSLLAVGITTMIVLPALINISVVLKMLPSKGMALPFVSAGGSSMLVSLVAMGVLLNISQQASATNS